MGDRERGQDVRYCQGPKLQAGEASDFGYGYLEGAEGAKGRRVILCRRGHSALLEVDTGEFWGLVEDEGGRGQGGAGVCCPSGDFPEQVRDPHTAVELVRVSKDRPGEYAQAQLMGLGVFEDVVLDPGPEVLALVERGSLRGGVGVDKGVRDGLRAVDEYMALHQHDPNATDLWSHHQRVLEWAKSTFPVPRKELKSVDWGALHHDHGSSFPDGKVMEKRVAELMADEDVTRKYGIYQYVLDGEENHLSIRAFTSSQKREAYERQQGICPVCGKHFELTEMEADHVQPWSLGGRTIPSNCKMLCKDDNRRKSNV